MAVYVDDMHTTPMGQFGRMKMCHMVADSTDELLAMADRIGVARRWIQKQGTYREHFDIATSKRAAAVKAGAIEVTMSHLGRIVRAKRVAASPAEPAAPKAALSPGLFGGAALRITPLPETQLDWGDEEPAAAMGGEA